MRNLFAAHGLSHVIVSGNVSSFVSDKFQKSCDLIGIKHIIAAPYVPNATANCEWCNIILITPVLWIATAGVALTGSNTVLMLLIYKNTR